MEGDDRGALWTAFCFDAQQLLTAGASTLLPPPQHGLRVGGATSLGAQGVP